MTTLLLTDNERQIVERALREWQPSSGIYKNTLGGAKAISDDIATARELAGKIRLLK